jgi:hypothetical protein
VTAWRAYAAAVTDSPVESWSELSREEIIELLDSEGTPDVPESAAPADDTQPAPVRKGPVWMVPTADGMVPEHEFNRRGR